MRHRELIESTSNDVVMHQQAQDASQMVTQKIYAGLEPYREVEFGKYGDFFLYLSRDIGFDTDFLILLGVRQKKAIGMSGMVMKFSEPIFGCDRAIVIYGMRQHTLEDMRSTVNSTGFIEVFQHEYLHLLDLMRTQERITRAKDIDPRNAAQYYNDPAEFNAFYHDTAGPMLEIIRYAETDPENVKDYMDLYGLTGNFQTDITALLSKNLHVQRFLKSLTPDRRKALMRRLYRVHQHMTDAVKRPVTEGRVYQIEWDYPRPVMVISDPSPPQARTLVKHLANRWNGDIYLRAVMHGDRVYVWSGHLMTHEDILSELLPDVSSSSSDVTTFEITNHTVVGFQKLEYHAARCRIMKPGDPNPERSPFVRNVMTAMDQLSKLSS